MSSALDPIGNPEELGEININTDVIAQYASLALLEVEGICSISGKNSFSDYVGNRPRDVDKGIQVHVDEEGHCTVRAEVLIEYNVNVSDAARKLQRAVKNTIENTVGMTVDRVEVTIKGLVVTEQSHANPRA